MMFPSLSWQYDEFRQVGRDYGSPAEVEIYDETHAGFRDIRAESLRVLDRLGLPKGGTLIDFGCGTGIFAVEAAVRGLRVHAVDVSEAMLSHAERRARQVRAEGIRFHHAGFLTYEHDGEPADAITSTFSFHHLPDFWKGIALQRLHRWLKPGGRLYLHDVVIASEDSLARINAFIEQQEAAGGEFLREDAEGHFRDEFSTYDWVMDGLVERAGFHILEKHIEAGVIGTYLSEKPA